MGGVGVAVLIGCSSDDDDDATPSESAEADATDAASEGTAEATAEPAGTTTATAGAEEISCILTPANTEGPYYVDEQLNRSDITSDPSDGSVKEGVPLNLGFTVYRIDGEACEPLADAVVDLWHCDALGVYSDVVDSAQGFDTTGQMFLRGYQVTDSEGAVEFQTIYPGWYEGRTVHMHFKVRTETEEGEAYELTSQIFFNDALSDQIFTLAPYSEKGAERGTLNDNDSIASDNLDQLLVPLSEEGDGYRGRLVVGIDLTQQPVDDDMSGGGSGAGLAIRRLGCPASPGGALRRRSRIHRRPG